VGRTSDDTTLYWYCNNKGGKKRRCSYWCHWPYAGRTGDGAAADASGPAKELSPRVSSDSVTVSLS
jgi:hypothetical protein